MNPARFILVGIVATVAMLTLGTIFVFGFRFLGPFAAAFGSPPASLGWELGSLQILGYAAAGMIGLVVVLIVWFVFGSVRDDRRQAYR